MNFGVTELRSTCDKNDNTTVAMSNEKRKQKVTSTVAPNTILQINMPLFSSKFTPKTIPVRKQDTAVLKNEFGSEFASRELSIEVPPLKLKLGEFEVTFDEGQWIPASGKAGVAHKENIRLKKELEQLEEENNMLRLKFEILLDMMTDKTVEAEQDVQKAQSNSLKVKNKKQKL